VITIPGLGTEKFVIPGSHFGIGLWISCSFCHRYAVAQPGVNVNQLGRRRMAKFNHLQIQNPSTNQHKIWNRWLHPWDDPLCKILCRSIHWGLLGKWVKYNENFSSIYIPFLLTDLQVRPPGRFSHAMAWMMRPHARVKPFMEPKFEVNINP